MADKSNIEWTDATWNPVTGCDRVSPGCAHCYALTFAERFRGVPGHYFEHGFDVQLRPDKLDLPLRWRKPRRIFVNSMSDLFHEAVPDEFIDRVFAVMALCGGERVRFCGRVDCDHEGIEGCASRRPFEARHIFQILTKRPERMLAYMTAENLQERILEAVEHTGFFWEYPELIIESAGWPLKNVWLGVSVENQRWADIRIPLLLQTPAAVRFISAEPLLGPVDLRGIDWTEAYLAKWRALREAQTDDEKCRTIDEIMAGIQRDRAEAHPTLDALTGYRTDGEDDVTQEGDPHLDWVIVGGESGPKRREMDLDWARSLRDQCRAAGVPYFFKQRSGPKPGMPSGDPDLDGCKEMPR